ncbi:unnamed protein product, partial [Adineta steineri]
MCKLNEDPTIINEINDKLTEKIQYLIEKILIENDRHGVPKTSGDSDIMFTSMDRDDFEERTYNRINPSQDFDTAQESLSHSHLLTKRLSFVYLIFHTTTTIFIVDIQMSSTKPVIQLYEKDNLVKRIDA